MASREKRRQRLWHCWTCVGIPNVGTLLYFCHDCAEPRCHMADTQTSIRTCIPQARQGKVRYLTLQRGRDGGTSRRCSPKAPPKSLRPELPTSPPTSQTKEPDFPGDPQNDHVLCLIGNCSRTEEIVCRISLPRWRTPTPAIFSRPPSRWFLASAKRPKRRTSLVARSSCLLSCWLSSRIRSMRGPCMLPRLLGR